MPDGVGCGGFLDIKPYTPERCMAEFELPDWLKQLQKYIQVDEGSSKPAV
jgi:tRNA (Thr-GGU) A37 N-methylase